MLSIFERICEQELCVSNAIIKFILNTEGYPCNVEVHSQQQINKPNITRYVLNGEVLLEYEIVIGSYSTYLEVRPMRSDVALAVAEEIAKYRTEKSKCLA